MGQDETNEEKRSAAARLVTRMMHGYFALSRGMTLGVRAACYDDAGRIFLVRHSYVPGWHMPGGGVERRETALQALSKELREEGNLEMTGAAQLFHVYFNTRVSRRDHVLFYRVNVLQTAPRRPDMEIVESGFFDLLDLPRGVTPATQRRLRELSGEVPPDDLW
ncbi:MAG: NUDIX domain-containing protein [Rhizobiaceae bacterium]|nr:NUDIX domain-containing protein [Rhizobiaceae bacterium]